MNITRHSLIFALSYALDIAGKNNLSHSKSTAYVSVQLGRELGLDGDETLSLYYAALLHDIGVSNEYVLYEHCKIGAEMLKKLPLDEKIPKAVLYHHEFCNGCGPSGLSGEDIPRMSQIIGFASAFDDMFGKNTDDFDRALFLRVQDWLEKVSPLFAQDIRDAFGGLLKRESFLLDYFATETKYALSEKLMIGDDTRYGYDEVLLFAECFADIIDRRSPFTYTHSHGIANLARKGAAYLGYDGATQNKMYIAGLLHDIGKLHVSTDILHKNGKLDPEERFEINKHTYYSRKVLEQIPGFEDITEYAANHHEKLDGTGYPYRIPGERLGELERLMAVCDVFQALTEERPYRSPMPEEKVWEVILGMAERGHLDGNLANRIKEARIWTL
ncbi:MAG: HD domain-containing protein [Oscillospiraceae bacterium]|jgi:putative nucleotidyltransferase with HDIG domain|nr:HD domain-containing protein [Oscillospiraceae bacterium]